MGNNKSKPPADTRVEYEKFGEVVVKEFEDKQTGDTLSSMEFTRQVHNEKEYNDWAKQISRIEDSQSRDTILLPDKHNFVKSGLCGGNGSVELTYQNFPFVLSSEISNRYKLGRFFNEAEMWYLLYSMIRAANKFEKVKRKIGDVNPNNILINDDGQIKVLSTCSIPNEIDNFHKKVEDKNARVYLAPEELREENIQKGEYPSDVDPCRAEVFSIGLTILSSGILEDCFVVYEQLRVNQNRLHEKLGIFREKYSNYLFGTLVTMLELNPNQRRIASQIYNQLSPYEQNILELEPFGERSEYINPQQRPVSYDPHYPSNVVQSHFTPAQNNVYPYHVHNSSYVPVQNNPGQRAPPHNFYPNQSKY